MAVTFNHLTTGSDTSNATSFTTASVAPAATRILYVAILANISAGTTPIPTLSGLGLSWDLVRQAPDPSALRTLYWFRAATGGSAPTPGTLTFNFGSALTGASWVVYEAAGAEMSGTNGSGATLQSIEQRLTGGANTAINFAFASPLTSGSGTLAVVGLNVVSSPITPGTGWATTGGTATHTAPTESIMGMHANAGQQNVTASWASAGNTWVIAVEVKAAGATSLNALKVGATQAGGLYVGSTAVDKAYLGTTQIWP